MQGSQSQQYHLYILLGAEGANQSLLGGSCDLVTFYNWGYNPTYNRGNPYKAIEGGYK